MSKRIFGLLLPETVLGVAIEICRARTSTWSVWEIFGQKIEILKIRLSARKADPKMCQTDQVSAK